MKIEYNGVEMALVEIHSYERQNVYSSDHADLLYVRHRINLTAQVVSGGQPWGTAAARVSDKDARLQDRTRGANEFLGDSKGALNADLLVAQNKTPAVDKGEFYAASDRLLVPRLLTPRRQLKLTAYRVGANGQPQPFVFLQSPRPGMNIDSLNGPHPLGCTVTEPTGEAPVSAVVNFQIETHLPLVDTDAARPIISHRWTTVIGHDEDYYATREISGEAVFDTALMARYDQLPDAFLSQLYHPIPLGYRRNLPHVELSSDGSHLTYQITDTAVPCVFDAADSGATQLLVAENWKFQSPKGLNFWGDTSQKEDERSWYNPRGWF